MTIRQQGGVFGRNPTFNDVEAQTIEVTDISLPDSGEASFGNSNDLKIYHDGSNSYVQETGVGSLLIYGSNMRLGNSDGSKLYFLANSGDKADIYFDGAVKIRTQSTGAQIFGDLAFSSGNGIDFSATSGTGTSELFNDYEEGTWTPVVTGSTSGSITLSASGYYTKVGNLVTVELYDSNVDMTPPLVGNIELGGLPFSASRLSPVCFHYTTIFAVTNLYGSISGTSVKFTNNSNSLTLLTNTSVSALTARRVGFTCTYRV